MAVLFLRDLHVYPAGSWSKIQTGDSRFTACLPAIPILLPDGKQHYTCRKEEPPLSQQKDTERQLIMALKFEHNGEKQRTPAGKKRTRNISFYAALVLCAGAVTLTAITSRTDHGAETPKDIHAETGSFQDLDEVYDSVIISGDPQTDTWQVSQPAVSPADTHPDYVPDIQPAVQTTTSTAPLRTSDITLTTAPFPTEAVPASAPLRFRMPSDGSITSGFSGDELIFCATMCDWRVHNGIDISGELKDEVRACADGIVEGFVEDMLYGNTAIVRHADDSVLYYCGLDDTQMVSTGLQVKAGDLIGYIGQIPCELDDGPHIHLSLMKDGQFIDPATILSMS